ncbi:MAG: HdeD family acid-resistance protein [Candidatus Limnocylindrales bacterium]
MREVHELLTRHWWVFAVRGILAIAFGILAFVWPGLTLLILVTLFAAYVFVDGLDLLIALARGDAGARRHWVALGLMGIVGIIVGIVAFFLPGLTALSLLYIAAFWAIILGVIQVAAAIRLRHAISGELWMAIGGLISIAFGVYLVLFPGPGLLSLVWLVGLWGVIFGLTSIILAWRLRRLHYQGFGAGSGGMARAR